MWVNPRLTSKLAEAYSNGEMMRSFGGNYNNTYLNNSYNNYRGDAEWLVNRNEGVNQINSYTSNPDGLAQQQRFNEIATSFLQPQ